MNHDAVRQRLRRDRALLMVVDVQEKLFPLMQHAEDLERRIVMAVRGCQELGVPVLVTEQNPTKLGLTIPSIADIVDNSDVADKTTFSSFASEDVVARVRESERDQLILVGIETHICVQSTALDALDEGYEVFVAVDATSSRLAQTGPIGIERMRSAGVAMTSAEGLLFEMLDDCTEDAFKRILPLVRNGS